MPRKARKDPPPPPFAAYAGYNQFEVTTVNGSKFAVNVARRDCGCRRWNLTGIPCHHAIACINKLGHNVENYLHDCYLTSNYEKCYSGIIYPMNGAAQWIATGIYLKAPPIAKMPGRPKKKRKQEAVDELHHAIHEDGVSILTKKNHMTVRCGKCGQSGHNKRTCPTAVVKEVGSSSAAQNSTVDNVDEEEMRQAYQFEAVMEMQLPEDAPPLTQPSQTIAREVQNPTTEQVINDDTPLAVAAKKFKKSKVVKKSGVTEKERRATIKKDQATKIDAIKAKAQANTSISSQSPRRSPRINNTAKAQENVDGAEMHNSYTGAMRLGPPPPPPVKQYKTIVGGTTMKSAPFQSHGKTVITKGTLQAAAAKLLVRRKLDGKK